MSPFSCLVLFTIIWWMTLFVTLPFGVRSQHEDDDIVPGSEPGAPQRSLIKRKMLVTTGITLVIFTLVFCIIQFKLFALTDIPFIPSFRGE